MRLKSWIAAVALVLISALPVSAGSMLLTGVGPPPASGTPFSITYVSNNNSVTGQPSYTFTAQNIGTADPTRIVVVGITAAAGPTGVVSSVTMDNGGGPVPAAQVSGAAGFATTNSTLSDIWLLAVPTGTTATIVVNFAASASRTGIAVFSVIGTGASVSTGANNSTNSSVNTLSQAATIPAGGGAIAVQNVHSSTAGAITPTNLTADNNLIYSNTVMESGHNASSSGSTSMGFAWAGTATDAALSIATFNP